MDRKPAAPPRRASRRYASYAILAAFFALVELRFILFILQRPFQLSSEVAEGVLRGEPLWRPYQSRVLAPYLVHALNALTGTFVDAYAAFALLVLFVSGFLVLALTDRLRDPARPPVAAFLLFQVTFMFLVPSLWLYPWDLLSLPLFIVFNYLVLRRARRAWFVLLYAIAVFNHEIAFFMAGWLVLDPLVRFAAGRRKKSARVRLDWGTFLLGCGLLLAGIALVHQLRETLLVREVLHPEVLPGLTVYGRSFHLTLLQNWNTIATSFQFESRHALPFVVPLMVVPVLVLSVRLARSDGARCAALSAVQVGMIAAYLCFGLIPETRVLMPLVPFVAMNGWAAFQERALSTS